MPGPHGAPEGYDRDGRVQGVGQPQSIDAALEQRFWCARVGGGGGEKGGLAKENLVEYPRGRTQAHDWVRQALCACAFDPRQEPGAVVPHAGICAGGAG